MNVHQLAEHSARIKITIVIATFNYGDVIGQTLDSLLRQSFSGWECVIVDDGSTDNTKEKLKPYLQDERFFYLFISNSGPSQARNFALRHARGQYIQFLDADDLLEEKKLEIHARFLDEHPEVDLVYGTAVPFDSNTPSAQWSAKNPYDDLAHPTGCGEEVLSSLFQANIMVISAPLFRVSLLEKLGRQEAFLPVLSGNEDWELWLRAALQGACFHFLKAPETRSLIRFHARSWSRAGTRMLESWVLLHELVAPEVANTPWAAPNMRGYYFALFNLATELWRQKRRREVVRIMYRTRRKVRSCRFLALWLAWWGLQSPLVCKIWTALKRLKNRP